MDVVNRMAQEKRLEAKKLPGFRVRLSPKEGTAYLGTPHVKDGEDTIFEGDRVMLGRNFTAPELQKTLLGRTKKTLFGRPKFVERKVCNGDLGPLLRIDPLKDTITLAIDGQKKELTLSLASYNRYGSAIHLGYAATVYKSQGSSISNVYVQAGADRELSYVATSRHKVRCQLYCTEADMQEGGEDLIRTMSKSHQKDLFLDVPDVRKQPSPELYLEL
jgi:ATP-dependent exoDNAse (exonuclease V) alpha subunit